MRTRLVAVVAAPVSLEMRQDRTHSLFKYFGKVPNMHIYSGYQPAIPHRRPDQTPRSSYSWVLIVFVVLQLGPTLSPVHSVTSRDESSRRQRLLAFGKLEATTATELPTP